VGLCLNRQGHLLRSCYRSVLPSSESIRIFTHNFYNDFDFLQRNFYSDFVTYCLLGLFLSCLFFVLLLSIAVFTVLI